LPCVRKEIENSVAEFQNAVPSPFWAFDSEFVRHCITILSRRFILEL
jgi:hypothetical protein